MDLLIRKIHRRLSRNISLPDDRKPVCYCTECQDIGWHRVLENDRETLSPCRCTIEKHIRRILENSGISEGFKDKTLAGFTTRHKPAKVASAKKAAQQYVGRYDLIKDEPANSIAFTGTVGSGKTHLSIAIANELMPRGISVRYFQYRTAMDAIKRNRMDEAYYYRQIMPYKRCDVLLIDDLYKGALRDGQLNESDLGIVFDIINDRYLNRKPLIISSEYTPGQIMDLDGAIGSRIIEMCRGRILEFSDPGLNHRLYS